MVRYRSALKTLEEGDYALAAKLFSDLGEYRDASEQATAALYLQADSLRRSGDYAEAYRIYSSVSFYKDAGQIILSDENLFEERIKALGASIRAGDTVKYGFYEQDNDPENGPEEVEWIVLDVRGDEALLLSRYILDAQTLYFNNWEESKVREWLNRPFLFEAFSYHERRHLKYVDLPAGENPNYPGEDAGGGTCDRVFLLSAAEAERYIPDDAVRTAGATRYAEHTAERSKAWEWRLRTRGQYAAYTMTVKAGGLNYDGRPCDAHSVSYDSGKTWTSFGLRPAIVIDLSPNAETERMTADEKWRDALFFSSPGCERSIREGLGMPEEPVRSEDLLKMEEFEWSPEASMPLLLEMKNLKKLVITWNAVKEADTDFSELAALSQLRSLTFRSITLKDSGFLKDLKNLESFSAGRADRDNYYIYDAKITDISAVSSLKGLTSLNLSGNRGLDISALSGLENLTFLNLRTCGLDDIRALEGLINLTELDLAGNRFTDIGALAGLKKLKVLYLSDNGIADYSPLALLPDLEELHVTWENTQYRLTGRDQVREFLEMCGALRSGEQAF